MMIKIGIRGSRGRVGRVGRVRRVVYIKAYPNLRGKKLKSKHYEFSCLY
jgi:hypothetical protein